MKDLKDLEIDLYNLPRRPFCIRIDINLPVDRKGVLHTKSPRIEYYGEEIKLVSEFVPLVVIAHQIVKGSKYFMSLNKHKHVLEKIIKRPIEIVKSDEFYSNETKNRIRSLKTGDILLYENIRMSLSEKMTFTPEKSIFVKFFKDMTGGINDAFPIWHKGNESVVGMSFLQPSYIGLRSRYELSLLNEAKITFDNNDAVVIMGGSKVEKIRRYLPHLAKKSPILLGGILGQLGAKSKGYNLGYMNEEFLRQYMKQDVVDILRDNNSKIFIPVDFVVEHLGERKVYSIENVCESHGLIKDIGPTTIEKYTAVSEDYPNILLGGTLGLWEENYLNTIEIVKKNLNKNIIIFGGETCSMFDEKNFLKLFLSMGGKMSLGGASFYHGLVGFEYPCLEYMKMSGLNL